ncbi:MAG TPA: CHRD domain-containing protein [Thermodesulfovibrionales bacterium]|nr:CHRD domain-containing protein [Thermodesulfovibrionales bacterium]
MRKIHLIIFLLVLGLATAGIAAEKSFKAMLSGSEVVPAVETMAKGEATFTLSKDGNELSYKVTVSDIENVTAAHIHMGKAGKSGPPLALIDVKGKKAGKFSGTLAEGKITAKELMGSLMGKSVKDLVKEMEAGNTYLNVHTEKYPDGELRGQIK